MAAHLKDTNPGKELEEFVYKDVRVVIGTVNYIELKSIYIDTITFYTPLVDIDFEEHFRLLRKTMLHRIRHWGNKSFNTLGIVDIDGKTDNTTVGKKSCLTLEIVLFPTQHYDFKRDMIKKYEVEVFIKSLIDLFNQEIMEYSSKKKG